MPFAQEQNIPWLLLNFKNNRFSTIMDAGLYLSIYHSLQLYIVDSFSRCMSQTVMKP